MTYAHLLALLRDDDMTVQQLVDATGLSRATVSPVLQALHKRRLVRIAEYRTDAAGRAGTLRCWGLNPDGLPDARRPPRSVSRAEATRRWAAKKRAMRQLQLMAGPLKAAA